MIADAAEEGTEIVNETGLDSCLDAVLDSGLDSGLDFGLDGSRLFSPALA